MTKSLAAATAAGSFHYVELSTNDGAPDDITGAAGPTTGHQVITERGASGTDVFDLRLVKGVVYFRGNTAAVIDQLRVPSSKAAKDAGRWVSLHKGQGAYATFAEGTTTKSNLQQLSTLFVARSSSSAGTPAASTRIAGALSDGKGHAPIGDAQLVIATSTSLPRSFSALAVSAGGARIDMSWTFGRWRERVTVKVPSGVVPYSSLGASPPSKKG